MSSEEQCIIVYFVMTKQSFWLRPHYLGFTITLDTTHSLGLPLSSDQPDTETSTLQHTTLTGDRHPCPRRDLNLSSQQANSRRPQY
jgi:hypothetical protein